MKDFISARERLSHFTTTQKDIVIFIEWTLLMLVIGIIGGMYV